MNYVHTGNYEDRVGCDSSSFKGAGLETLAVMKENHKTHILTKPVAFMNIDKSMDMSVFGNIPHMYVIISPL